LEDKVKKLLVLLALGAIIVPVMVFSGSLVPYDIPHQINYQGMLTDNDGNPLTGNFDILFKIYNHPSAGTKQWEETQTGVWVNEGLFNVILGSVDPIDLDFYETDEYWLDITVGGVGGEHMPQRLKFTSVAFAYRAQRADTAAYAIAVPEGNLDDRYVNVNGPDSVRGSSSSAMFRVRNSGTGDGIQVYAATSTLGDGIDIDTAGDHGIEISNTGDDGISMDDIHGYGIYICDVYTSDGIRIFNPGNDGISMDEVGDDGIHMDDVAGDGIYMEDVEGHGIYINDAANNGLYVKKADCGVYVDSAIFGPGLGGGDGVFVRYAYNSGIWVKHANDEGVGVTNADGDGFYVGHADRWGLFINDSDDDGIYVSSADKEGITAFGSEGGGELHSLSPIYNALRVHSYNDMPDNLGLYVYGTAYSTGGWSGKLSGSSGDVPAFSVVSRDVEVIASGTGTLVAGQAQIAFEPEFQEAISTEVPIRVVVTAQDAPSALLYVTNKSTQGFTVKPLEIPELSLKTDNVSFDWIAIARQKGYEQRPEVIMEEEGSMADQISREEAMRAEELRHQEELEREELYRQEMLEKQARKEAERREREREEESTD
jgi:hypothetical protein